MFLQSISARGATETSPYFVYDTYVELFPGTRRHAGTLVPGQHGNTRRVGPASKIWRVPVGGGYPKGPISNREPLLREMVACPTLTPRGSSLQPYRPPRSVPGTF